jgi:hypothetical protein
MPSYLHEALVEILRGPDLLLGLCAPKLTRLAPHDKIVTDSGDLGSAQPSSCKPMVCCALNTRSALKPFDTIS